MGGSRSILICYKVTVIQRAIDEEMKNTAVLYISKHSMRKKKYSVQIDTFH